MEVWRCAAGVQAWRHRGMKLWSFAVKSRRGGGICLERSGAREACRRSGDGSQAKRGAGLVSVASSLKDIGRGRMRGWPQERVGSVYEES